MTTQAQRRSARVVAAILAIVGGAHLVPGLYLAVLGGSPYYALAGIGFVVTAWLLWRDRASAYAAYAVLFAGTLAWALWEVGLNGWELLPRVDVILVGALALSACWLARRGWHQGRSFFLVGVLGAMGVALLVVASTEGVSPPNEDDGRTLSAVAGDADWQAIGKDNGAQRFSTLSDITPHNVGSLRVAWRVHLGVPPKGMTGVLQSTPIKVGNLLYMCGMANDAIAIDAESGSVRWRYDPAIDRVGASVALCRGVTFVPAPPADSCGDRIILLTRDARMIALRAADGRPCPTFGARGAVDLNAGMGAVPRGYLTFPSPATLVRGRLVIGGAVIDGQFVGEPSGVIRAFDALTGRFAWAWDMGRPGETGMPLAGGRFTPGTPNGWAPMSGDEALGLIFVPLGSATPDYVAAHRSPAMNRYGNSIVALDAATGRLRWSYQTIHRDVWDYDNPSPPTLVDFPMPYGTRPAVIVPTKRGVFFVLDRATGRPLVETVERAVPRDTVPGERVAATQPYPIGMPSLGNARLVESDMWGMTPFDQLWCRIAFRQSRYEGDFTPVGLMPTIVAPGYFGGSEWTGVAVDPVRNIMIANVSHIPNRNRLIPRNRVPAAANRIFQAGRGRSDISLLPQIGTAYAAAIAPFISPLQVPCTRPPFAELAAIDLATRRILWRRPLGTAMRSGPFGTSSGLPITIGAPAAGGVLVTATGLLFIAATQDGMIRAYSTQTGTLLWRASLPAGGHANPITYRSPASGRQMIVVPASGRVQLNSGAADELIAFALPRVRATR